MAFSTATGTITATLSSGATAPAAVGSQQATGNSYGQQVTSGLWSIAAGPGDPGATLTFGATGGTGGAYWFNVGLVAYAGALATDVSGGNNEYAQGQTTADITTPSLTTMTADDWQVQIVAGGPPNGFDFSGAPGGLMVRESITSSVNTNAGLLMYVADSNGTVGAGGRLHWERGMDRHRRGCGRERDDLVHRRHLPVHPAAAGRPLVRGLHGDDVVSYITGLTTSPSAGGYWHDQDGQPRFLMYDNPWALVFNSGEWNGSRRRHLPDGYQQLHVLPGGAGVHWRLPVRPRQPG